MATFDYDIVISNPKGITSIVEATINSQDLYEKFGNGKLV
jgi:hypothetical protein